MSSKPEKVFNVRYNKIQNKNILVQHNQAYEIDEVGLTIWGLCDSQHTFEEIALSLSQEYDVDVQQALNDCQEFIKDLTSKGLLQ